MRLKKLLPVACLVLAVATAWHVAPMWVDGIGGTVWMWLALATLVTSATVFSRDFVTSLAQRDKTGCFYCWLSGVIGPWVLFAVAFVESFSATAGVRGQGAILALIALLIMLGRLVLMRLKQV